VILRVQLSMLTVVPGLSVKHTHSGHALWDAGTVAGLYITTSPSWVQQNVSIRRTRYASASPTRYAWSDMVQLLLIE